MLSWRRALLAVIVSSVAMFSSWGLAASFNHDGQVAVANSAPVATCDDSIGIEASVDASKQLVQLDLHELAAECSGQKVSVVVTNSAGTILAQSSPFDLAVTSSSVSVPLSSAADVAAVHRIQVVVDE